MVTSDRVSMTFTPQGVSDDANDELSLLQRKIASQLTDYARTVAENTKFDEMNSNGLLMPQYPRYGEPPFGFGMNP